MSSPLVINPRRLPLAAMGSRTNEKMKKESFSAGMPMLYGGRKKAREALVGFR